MDSRLNDQEQVLAALSQPAIYGGNPVQIYKTHASVVFLAGDRAIKVKRAVRFPFLDYSTLDRRKAACEAEVEVNKQFAPEIYLGVVPITMERDGSYKIDGSGDVVEWAVHMRRFDDNETLDRLAECGELDEAMSLQLADTVLDAHRAAPIADTQAWLAALRSFVDQNRAAFSSWPDLFPAGEVEILTSSSIAAYNGVLDLLRVRGSHGFIKRLHGDLHLGNIVRIDSKPVLFDAIEFDPVIASGDVLYDLAFLLMDVRERGLSQAASLIFNRYLEQSGEHLEALKALPLFLSMRAAIRAKVTAARLDAAPASDRSGIADAARRYFQFALAALRPNPPMLVAVGGLSGTGKSMLARRLAPRVDPMPGAVVLRSDRERKRMFGVSEFDRLPAKAYAEDVSHDVYSVLVEKTKRTLAAGHSVIVDAVFARAHERDHIRACAGEHVRFHGVFLVADTSVLLARLDARLRDVSDADRHVALTQAQYDLGHIDWIEIDASGTPGQTLDAAVRLLGLGPG